MVPFLTAQKTSEQMIDYYRHMLVSPGVSRDFVYRLSPEQLNRLSEYVNESRTASSVPRDGSKGSREIVTAELIYHWLTEFKIPFEPTNSWHLSQLLMLVEITAFKKQPPKKQKASDFMEKFRAANEAAKKRLNSNG